MKKKIFLLDAMALIYRAYFALSKNPRITSKGFNTSAALGFTNTLYDIIVHQQPTHIAAAFDMKGPTFRHRLYPAYKAHREKQPEDITENLPVIREIIAAFDIPIFEHPDYEADDVIGSLAIQAKKFDFDVYMVTSDKDYAQLVDERIYIYKPPSAFVRKAQILGIPEVLEKFGIHNTKQVIDFLALQGDTSDNIPGIPGVGPKTASKYLQQYGSIEKLFENVQDIKGKAKENLINYKEDGLISKKLATIVTDVPCAFDEEALLLKKYDKQKLKRIFDTLEFKALAKRIFSDGVKKQVQLSLFPEKQVSEKKFPEKKEEEKKEPSSYKTVDTVPHDYQLVDTEEKINQLAKDLSQQKSFAFDTETTNIDPIHAQLVGISFSYQKHEAFYIPIDETNARERLLPFIGALSSPDILKIGQNLKYDLLVMMNYDIEVQGPFFDTMLAQYLIEPEGKHNLDHLSHVYLEYEPIGIATLLGEKKKINMREVPIDQVAIYAAEDADITFQLKDELEKVLDNDTLHLLKQVEFPLILVLAKMEYQGINIDQETLKEYSEILTENAQQLQKEIYQIAGVSFNIASAKQLGEVLFDKLKLVEKPRKTKTGQYATGEEVLSKIRHESPIIEKILEFRQCVKLKNTYVDALPLLASPKDQRLHTTFSQAVVATGRLSSNHPNLQNIPIRTKRGKTVRKAFVPQSEDYIMMSVDYSQMELRIMASFAHDQTMIDAFTQGIDIHRSTAAKIFKIPIEGVTSEQRSVAKTANFGIIYGISAFGLSQQLNIPREEAKVIIDTYFNEFPKIKQYIDEVIAQAQARGYVETMMKRKRYLRDINSRNHTQQRFAARNAINAPIQGSAADITKMAMIAIDRWMVQEQLKSKMLLQVHDELIFDIHKSEKALFEKHIPSLMRDVSTLVVPMEVEIGFGANWLEAH